jgi:hypothetical protein
MVYLINRRAEDSAYKEDYSVIVFNIYTLQAYLLYPLE